MTKHDLKRLYKTVANKRMLSTNQCIQERGFSWDHLFSCGRCKAVITDSYLWEVDFGKLTVCIECFSKHYAASHLQYKDVLE